MRSKDEGVYRALILTGDTAIHGVMRQKGGNKNILDIYDFGNGQTAFLNETKATMTVGTRKGGISQRDNDERRNASEAGEDDMLL